MLASELEAYLARIGLKESPSADADGLDLVQRAHRLAIPFENLDIPLGRGISLAPDAIFDKLVTRRRGGYCFEQNALFLDALRAIGFSARALLARVWLMAEGVPPRTHTLNLVTIAGRDWIADAGFGGGYTPPMPLENGAEAETPDRARHRLRVDADHGWMLERDAGEGWAPQYSFMLDMVHPADLALSNHWTSTAPDTRFTTLRIVSLALPNGLASLVGRRYNRANGDRAVTADIETATAYRLRLQWVFGITLSPEEVGELALFEV